VRVNAAVKYSLGRIGLFLAVLLALWPVRLNIFLKLMIAVLASAGMAYFLLRAWRDETAQQLARTAQRRRAEKDRLRAALAGEDTPPATDTPQSDDSGEDPPRPA